MLIYLASILSGFVLLVWGADRFVIGAAATAHNLGVSSLLIGLTVVGFGTSAPEILVSINAAMADNPHLAVGNALGSNIANIALILGITALVRPLRVRSLTLRREMPVLLAVTLLTLLPFLDLNLSRAEGFALLSGLGLMMYWLVRVELESTPGDPMVAEVEAEIRSDLSMRQALGMLLLGLVVLLAASRLLVWAATNVATELGVSDLVIGLTIVAIGTSLPELAASITAAVKDEHDLAIGNVIGSNMYNLLAVLGFAAAIAPTDLERAVLTRDFLVLIGLTIALFAMAYNVGGDEGNIKRSEGAALLLAYTGYMGFLLVDQL
ncbi:MAG: calcium/sodium antiporter [Gammaproteobacteria bacterium]|nr:calcium/sodium antiporter [Gammaproteobacteria bacterium]NNF62454.1 calcium/sodium antiporter [Gammaproteobacteria bacterium]NNM21806.1 calcium/sodium antiporter [Gammaproteobacteria bacterium]